MKKFKKIVALALISSMSLSLLACNDKDSKPSGSESEQTKATESQKESEKDTDKTSGSDTESSEPKGGEETGGLALPLADGKEITINIGTGNENLSESLFSKTLEERLGIKINWETFPLQGYNEKIKSILSTGQSPNISLAGAALQITELNEYGDQGAFAKINDYYDDLPNFKSIYLDDEENNWYPVVYSSVSDNLYLWAQYDLNRKVNHGFMYRADVFEEQGIKPWTNQDEFYDALVKLKEAYPDSYPIVSKYKENIFGEWGAYWGMSKGSYYPFHYDETDGQWKFVGSDQKFKDMIDFMKKLYDEGLLDPEFLTDEQDPWAEKITNDKAFIFYDWIGRMPLFNTQMREINPKWDLRYANPVGPTGKMKSLSKITLWGPVVGASDPETEKICLQVLDYLSSPEGALLHTIGVEGQNFEWDGETPVYTELKDEPLIDIKLLESKYGEWLQGMALTTDKRSIYYDFSEEERQAQDMIKDDMFEPVDPIMKFTEEEQTKMQDLQTPLVDAILQFAANYVIADADYDQFLQQAESLNYKEVEDILNAAQARLDSALN
jgi:putative aldouronate transport system substrate-binding protein